MATTGGAANDNMYGSDGADTFRGNGGNDMIFAGLGDDDLDGSTGDRALR